ncbi:MAG: hypothetical protein CR986_02995 [Ignavibacteriae bacterium]|nr:MAG: hypothetical protein CR986_02995 [Ignavibacteriota bacterium]
MNNLNQNQHNVDRLIDHFWKNGYLTLSRRYGTYLPSPKNIGKYKVDAIGKLRKKYAIGIVLTKKELEDSNIYNKLQFLATRHTKYTNKKIKLFVGVPNQLFHKVKLCISTLSEDARKNIKLVPIENPNIMELF